MVFISLLFYALLVTVFLLSVLANGRKYMLMFVGYLLLILFFIFVRKGIIIGYLRGNAVRVTNRQFPDILRVAEEQAQKLGISTIPNIYILQAGGSLNALITRFLGGNYIVLFSDLAEAGFTRGNKSLSFILGHELAHIKRKHILKRALVFPSYIIPFLSLAYSRACEYTCDRIGVSVSSPEGAQHGLLMLAGGKTLFQQIDIHDYIISARKTSGFWQWVSEKLSTHPHLTKRLSRLFEIRY
ncbi:MAG: M48 family metallopeptidase [Bacteroidales bacterium]|nr:M48 family metallopeptidase [Bacteroidales bacterium]